MSKARVIILLALASLLALPMGIATANHFEGTAAISDDKAASDSITFSLKGVHAPSAGTQLVGWLISDDDATKLSTGAMTVASGDTVSHTFGSSSTGYTGANLIQNFSSLIITEEPSGAVPAAPSGATVYHYDIPTAAIAQIRAVASAGGTGSAQDLKTQLAAAKSELTLARATTTLDIVRTHTHKAINIIEGPTGSNYNATHGVVEGIGVLGHAQAAIDAAALVGAASADAKAAADLVQITAKNAKTFAELARDRSVSLVLTETNLAQLDIHLANVIGVVENAISGLDANRWFNRCCRW